MSDRLLVATRKGLFTVDRQAEGRWGVTRSAFAGDRLSLVGSDGRDGTLYAALDHGHFGAKLHRSRDSGESWEECAAPEYPPKPDDIEDVSPDGRPVPWNLELIWALEPGGDDQPGVLWCGTIPGGVFRSPDGGDSWQLVESLWHHPDRRKWFGGGADMPGVHSISVDPRDSRRVALAVSCGGVWETTDGGESWAVHTKGMFAEYMPPDRREDPAIQDPHCLVRCRAQPDRYWVQHHNGIFRSVDSGASWEERKAEPSSFGFAVAVHPDDADTAWFVPALSDEKRIPVGGQVVVTRTRDGGETFEVLSRGLPQEHAYDLTFRHALDVDARGQRLAFGSTTGNLWISEDQGDSWQAVSHHLPPVYCVRFVG